MHSTVPTPLEAFQWSPQPEAEAFVRAIADSFLRHCACAQAIADRMRSETGTRFFDWIDAIFVPDEPATRQRLSDLGFRDERDEGIYAHPKALFPRIGVHALPATKVLIKVESAADFAAANDLRAACIEGEPLAPLRLLRVAETGAAALWAVERHGERGFDVPHNDAPRGIRAARCREVFRTRLRHFADERDGFTHARRLIDGAIEQLGTGLTCDLFFAAEREYWQRRNGAARVQKARQDRLGLGWANHDHHTYRSSREHFIDLIGVFERLGFHCRERFYAGAEAGWGAQVLEQPEAGVVIFADVDLAPEELLGDFAHEKLPPRETLGTVGLWCALHGEAFLEAGMHHLECQFDFDALRRQLEEEASVRVMKPFTDFPYLRQAFTEGETWPVRPERIECLRAAGRITPEQARRFAEQGALGSHLENLERNAGFKGFNQTGVSEIIARTDPRKGREGKDEGEG